MGIDPGTNCMGYALLKVVGKKPVILVSGILELKKLIVTQHWDSKYEYRVIGGVVWGAQ